MKKIIDIPDTEMGLHDNFQDFFKRLRVEIKTHMITGTDVVCGPLELETIDTLLEAFKNSETVESVTDFVDRCRLCGKTKKS